MSRRADARDVLDADATTSRALTGRVVGVYRLEQKLEANA